MCNLLSGTVFSKEANVSMSDMSFLGVKTKDFLRKQSELLTNQASFGLERLDPSEDRSDSPENPVFAWVPIPTFEN